MRSESRVRGRALLPALLGVSSLVLASWTGAPGAAAAEEFTSSFDLERCTWSWGGAENRYFPLRGGFRLLLAGEEEDDGELVEVEQAITVLRQTRRITFQAPGGRRISLIARIVEEREWQDGELAEVSRNFLARCAETNDVFYFGEEVDFYEDGEIVGHDGAWLAGRNGAQPGIVMPGRFLLGSRYFQEIAPGVALDRGENVAMGETVETPAGTFHSCVRILDSNALDPAGPGDEKTYCPGLGLVKDGVLELEEHGTVPPGEE